MVYKTTPGKNNDETYTINGGYEIHIKVPIIELLRTRNNYNTDKPATEDKKTTQETVILIHAFDLNKSGRETVKKRERVEKELCMLVENTNRVVTLYAVLLLSKDPNTVKAAFDKEEWLFNKLKLPGDKLSLDRDSIMVRIGSQKNKSMQIAHEIIQERCQSYWSYHRERDAHLISKLF